MNFIDLSFPDPESNIAMDEALLESADAGHITETLRVWESPVYFAVLGYSSKWKNEIVADANIPFIRRKSGGQTILQGPGCINFSLIIKNNPQTGIKSDTANAMKKNLHCIQKCLPHDQFTIQGVSDLVCQGRKFSGNAMRRSKQYHLFHGTFLYDFDLSKIQSLLGSPDREPEYRKMRSHEDFLMNIKINREQIINSLRETWKASEALSNPPLELIKELHQKFYSDEQWNKKF